MHLLLSLLVAAAPASHFKGLDKPRKEQRATLGDSGLAQGKVRLHCQDAGSVMLVQVDDPGLKGARDAWLKKKSGDALPPCDGREEGVTHLPGIPGYGYVAGLKGEYLFATTADAFGDRMGVRVFALPSGEQVYEAEFSTQHPISLHQEGKALLMRFHLAVTVTCEAHGAEAAACWKQVRDDAKVPEALDVKAPPCDAAVKNKGPLGATVLVALPAEVDLSGSPRKPRFVAGAATCAEAP